MAKRETSGSVQAPLSDARGLKTCLRQALHNVVPSHFQDPFGLMIRILKSGNSDAISALVQAGVKLGLTPVDLILEKFANATVKDCATPKMPILLVTGPPRSGTTLFHQVIIRSLPVAYISNLASLLPRAAEAGAYPLTGGIANERVRLESYYGRTRSISGPSDGLEFWDLWFGPDRRAIPKEIKPAASMAMRRFFARLEHLSGRPVVAKNNNLLGSAHLVADALPTARFVCLRRDPLFLAQSLLKARRDIHGSNEIAYGLDRDDPTEINQSDPVKDVCRQVRLYQDLEAEQIRNIGKDRFITVSYEDLCKAPSTVARQIGQTVFGIEDLVTELDPFPVKQQRVLSQEEFRCLKKECYAALSE